MMSPTSSPTHSTNFEQSYVEPKLYDEEELLSTLNKSPELGNDLPHIVPKSPLTHFQHSNMIELMTDPYSSEGTNTSAESITETAVVLRENPTSFEMSDNDILIDSYPHTNISAPLINNDYDSISESITSPRQIPLPKSPSFVEEEKEEQQEQEQEHQVQVQIKEESTVGIDGISPELGLEEPLAEEIQDVKHSECLNTTHVAQPEQEMSPEFAPEIQRHEAKTAVSPNKENLSPKKKETFWGKFKKFFGKLLGNKPKNSNVEKTVKEDTKPVETVPIQSIMTALDFTGGSITPSIVTPISKYPGLERINTNLSKSGSQAMSPCEGSGRLTPIYCRNIGGPHVFDFFKPEPIAEHVPVEAEVTYDSPEEGSDAYNILKLCEQSFFGNYSFALN